MDPHAELAALLDRVRGRWRRLITLLAWTRAATLATLAIVAAFIASRVAGQTTPLVFVAWVAAAAVAIVCLAWALRKLSTAVDDRRVARFIEERCPDLDDALATAMSPARAARPPAVAAAILEDAVRRVQQIDLDRIVTRVAMRDASRRALAATIALVIVCGVSAVPIMRSAQLFGLYMFPGRLGLQVIPGDVRVKAGDALEIRARIPTTIEGVIPVLRVGGGQEWRNIAMQRAGDGAEFTYRFTRVEDGFTYHVAAASALSRDYAVTVVRPPRVERVDLRYDYPATFRMEPRIETDGGDIYGPAGTRVHVAVYTDKDVVSGALTLGDGTSLALKPGGRMAEGDLVIRDDGSYRVALADADGLKAPGDTEYFIRTLDDRPPDVRIVRPASDRQVTPIEEVSIEARADDDFGVASFELVYAVRGGQEKAVPFTPSGGGMTVSGRRTIYLEDLQVQPGDFVTYYARARDVSRGKRSTESRSDIFFLEVSPFDEEFVAAQSNGMSGSGDQEVDDLVESQKNIITATWKLDRRGRSAGAASQTDVQAVARAQAEVRRRALASAAQMQRTSDLRRRRPGVRTPPTGPPTREESEDAMGKAAEAMLGAQRQLEALKTSPAIPFEMTALNELLRAQADVRRREVQRQQNGNGAGRAANRQQQDLSSLFDRELARQQQTNYETPRATSESRPQTENEALEKVKELASRQEALNKAQQALDKGGMPEEQRRRELERLTREQSELRQQAENLARQMKQNSGAMSGVSEEMRAATSDLRRQDTGEASRRGGQALERLRQLERQMGGGQGADRRRAAGEMQLESRQIADAQRQLSEQAQRQGGAGETRADAERRAGEQNRLADRMQRLEESLKDGQLDRQRLSQRMRGAARASSGEAAREGADIARQLDRLAERLGNASGESDEARRLGEELARMRELRDRLGELDRQLAEQGQRGPQGRQGQRGQAGQRGEQPANSPWDGTRQLLEELRREGSIGLTPGDVRGFNPGQSAPGTEAWKQDYAKWDELKTQLAAALEKAEASAAARLRGQQATDRLNAGASQAVPEQYRRLVEQYYRALASKPQGRP